MDSFSSLSSHNTEKIKSNFRHVSSIPLAQSKDVSTKIADLPSGLHVGSVIEHQRFGVGTVDKLEGEGENLKATVSFRNTGTKMLLLKFARFKILN
jgi:DNA helicase-2/ATP-dependent DNA helicase PcrA